MHCSLPLLALFLFVITSGPSSRSPLRRVLTTLALSSTPAPTRPPPRTITRTPNSTRVPTHVPNTRTTTRVSPTPTFYFPRFTATATRRTQTPRPTQALARATADLT